MQVYVIGDVGILEELDLKGYQYIGGPADNDKKIELSPGYALEHDHDVRPSFTTTAPFDCLTLPAGIKSALYMSLHIHSGKFVCCWVLGGGEGEQIVMHQAGSL